MTKGLSITKRLYDSGKESYSMTQGLELYDSMIQVLSDLVSLKIQGLFMSQGPPMTRGLQ